VSRRSHRTRNKNKQAQTNPETPGEKPSTVTNPAALPQIQKRWGVVGTNPKTDHKSRNVGCVTATNPEAQTQKVLFCS
jgi:hypothetical protein